MKGALGAFLVLACALPARAANLDVSASYRMRALSYRNLNLDLNNKNAHDFISNDARLGVAVRRIALETRGEEETTMDVGIVLHALGVSNSTFSLSSPLDRAAANYPSADFTPFLENAYLKVTNLFGYPVEATFGRQTYRLASGLLLDDDGAGINGVRVRGELPWWTMKLEGFVFNAPNPNLGSPSSVDFFGASLDLPTEGVWQLSQMFERDRTLQMVQGCSQSNPVAGSPCLISKAMKSFTSLRYQLNYGPMVFDAEFALQKGAAIPTGPTPAPNHITYNGDAQVIKAKWKQSFYRGGEGIARLSVARGSGDKPDTLTTDEAFFPSHGHRYSGLERAGMGEFFGATPYDALGGNYNVPSGLSAGASGIVAVGGGYTFPAFKGIAMDLDYFLFQAERIATGSRTLGSEWDVKFRYNIQDRFALSAGAAFFNTGTASNPAKGAARKWSLEASGRF